jgi:N-acetylmuramoyl-L-alanine amidase
MKTNFKASYVLVIVLSTLIPLTTFFYYYSKQKTNTIAVAQLTATEPVLGPIYNELIQAEVPIVQATSAQNETAKIEAARTQNEKAAPVKKASASSNPNRSTSPLGQSIGKSPLIGSYTQQDLYWLAKMVSAEADGEPYQGKVAVAAVILHRVISPEYPKTIKEVLFQVVNGHYQFSPVLTGYINQVEPTATAYKAAKDALAGIDPSKGAILYYNPQTSTNKWILSKPITVVIGNHTFAK